MVPYYQWNFAPVVRGIARTQARVEVLRDGYTVSNELVPSGPFELTNLPLGGSGELKVIIHESDGTKQVLQFHMTHQQWHYGRAISNIQ